MVEANQDFIEFKAIRLWVRPKVRVDASGISYEQRRAMTKLSRWRTIPKASITAVDVKTKVGTAVDSLLMRKWVRQAAILTVTSTTETIEFRTDPDTAERARGILLSQV